MKIPRDDGLLSEPTTEVNGNDPLCKRVGAYSCFHSKDSLNYLYSKDGFSCGHSIQYKMLLVRVHVYRSIKT